MCHLNILKEFPRLNVPDYRLFRGSVFLSLRSNTHAVNIVIFYC